ncbi:MAG TPA: hypothetical protein VFR37_08525 [Longimicrobium sp.]|nr:hypothetical protein [Longimicrobium sp.]
MSARGRSGDVWSGVVLAHPLDALRFAMLRAENEGKGEVRTFETGSLQIVWRHVPADRKRHYPARNAIELRRRGSLPDDGDRRIITRMLETLGFPRDRLSVQPTEDERGPLLRITVLAAPPSPPAGVQEGEAAHA